MGKRGGEAGITASGEGFPHSPTETNPLDIKRTDNQQKQLDTQHNLSNDDVKSLDMSEGQGKTIQEFIDRVTFADREYGLMMNADGKAVGDYIKGRWTSMPGLNTKIVSDAVDNKDVESTIHYHPTVHAYPSSQDIYCTIVDGSRKDVVVSTIGVSSWGLNEKGKEIFKDIPREDRGRKIGNITRAYNKALIKQEEKIRVKFEKIYTKKYGEEFYMIPEVNDKYYSDIITEEFSKLIPALAEKGVDLRFKLFY